MCNGLKIARDFIARRASIFNFLPLLASHCFLGLAQQKVKEKFLCDLCASSEAGGEINTLNNAANSTAWTISVAKGLIY